MLNSPYPTPALWPWTLAMVAGALAGVGAGAWVIVSPPKSYDNIGLALTLAWGIMLALGSLLIAVAHLVRVHQIEIPGLVFALGGVATYDFLSWQQTLSDSPGSGPRALLLAWIAMMLLARLMQLIIIDVRARRRLELREALDAG